MTSCNNLVSADVPFSLEVIARQAEEDYGGDFQKLSEKEALEKLQNDKTPTAKMFSNFLEKHGHRCLHEVCIFDNRKVFIFAFSHLK